MGELRVRGAATASSGDDGTQRSSVGDTAPVYTVTKRRHYGRTIVELVVMLAVLGAVAYQVVRSQVLNFDVVGQYLVSGLLIHAVWNTLLLSTVAMVIAFVLGTILALWRVGGSIVLSRVAYAYVYVFRGTPMLVQLLIWFDAVPIVVKHVDIRIPLTHLHLIDAPTTSLVGAFGAALMGLSLAESAYMSEVIRSGILAVDSGQRDAARAIGLTERSLQRTIVIPQAFRVTIPAIGNQYIMMLKNSSLASVIGYVEIVRVTSDIYSENFEVLELLIVATIWYLVLTALISGLQLLSERVWPAR